MTANTTHGFTRPAATLNVKREVIQRALGPGSESCLMRMDERLSRRECAMNWLQFRKRNQ